MNYNTTPELPHDAKSRRVSDGNYFYLKERPEEELSIACGGIEHCSIDYRSEQTEFRYYGIEYIVSGRGRLTIDGVEQELAPGSLFCYGPSNSYTIENVGPTPLVKRFIEFTGANVKELLSDTLLESSNAQNLRRETWIKDAFQNMQECGIDGDEHASEACNHLFRYFLTRLRKARTPQEGDMTPSYIAFETCKSYLENFYSEISAAHEVANACNISHPHLCRLFKRFSNETPTKMLLRLKLTRSLDLLEQGNLLVKEVAEKVGFEDQYYFSKRFKEFFGVSPKNYLGAEGIALSA